MRKLNGPQIIIFFAKKEKEEKNSANPILRSMLTFGFGTKKFQISKWDGKKEKLCPHMPKVKQMNPQYAVENDKIVAFKHKFLRDKIEKFSSPYSNRAAH